MVCKGDRCIIKTYDNKKHEVKVTKIDGSRAHIQYENKIRETCSLRRLMKKTAVKPLGLKKHDNESKEQLYSKDVSSKEQPYSKDVSSKEQLYSKDISEKPERLCKHFKKIGKNMVSFGMHKSKNLTYQQILKQHEDYCRIVVRNNYNVPADFKAYCCFELL